MTPLGALKTAGLATTLLAVTTLAAACDDGRADDATADTDDEPSVVLEVPDTAPGDIISLRADGTAIEWINRLDGQILRADLGDDRVGAADAGDVEVVATVEVGTDGEQRGLLGTAVIDGRRFAAWTQPDSFDLVVGELVAGSPPRIVWDGGGTAGGAVGGHLDTLDGQIVLGVGQLTDFAKARNREAAESADAAAESPEPDGAMLLLDPDGPADQVPQILSEQYINPFAFVVTGDGELWVADNAVDDADAERIGRGDLINRGEQQRSTEPPRAPAVMVELADGRLGVCGFLDGQMEAFERVETDDVAIIVERAGTIGPCQTGAAVLDNGDVITVTEGTFTRVASP